MLAESLRRSIHKAAVSGLLFGENGSDSWVKADVKNVIASHKGGGTPSKTEPQFWGGDIPWASIKDLKGDRICETVDSITVDGLEGSSSNLIRAGAVIVAMRMGVGKVGGVRR